MRPVVTLLAATSVGHPHVRPPLHRSTILVTVGTRAPTNDSSSHLPDASGHHRAKDRPTVLPAFHR